MQETMTKLANRPAWVDLSATDAAAARDFYSQLFSWEMDLSDDPQYGGYATARVGAGSAGGIGPKQDPNAPSAWSLYIGTDDVDALAEKIKEAGGTVVFGPADVGNQGRFGIFQDPSGGFFSGWQAGLDQNFVSDKANTFGWAELNARVIKDVLPFYERVFGWTIKSSESAPGQPPYNEFQLNGESILGAWEMSPQVPAYVPTYWQIYFNVDDVDAAYAKALKLGATEMLGPQDFPGGRFAIVSDPQGASFGLLKTAPRPA